MQKWNLGFFYWTPVKTKERMDVSKFCNLTTLK
jgi:hypothetical protein